MADAAIAWDQTRAVLDEIDRSVKAEREHELFHELASRARSLPLAERQAIGTLVESMVDRCGCRYAHLRVLYDDHDDDVDAEPPPCRRAEVRSYLHGDVFFCALPRFEASIEALLEAGPCRCARAGLGLKPLGPERSQGGVVRISSASEAAGLSAHWHGNAAGHGIPPTDTVLARPERIRALIEQVRVEGRCPCTLYRSSGLLDEIVDASSTGFDLGWPEYEPADPALYGERFGADGRFGSCLRRVELERLVSTTEDGGRIGPSTPIFVLLALLDRALDRMESWTREQQHVLTRFAAELVAEIGTAAAFLPVLCAAPLDDRRRWCAHELHVVVLLPSCARSEATLGALRAMLDDEIATHRVQNSPETVKRACTTGYFPYSPSRCRCGVIDDQHPDVCRGVARPDNPRPSRKQVDAIRSLYELDDLALLVIGDNEAEALVAPAELRERLGTRCPYIVLDSVESFCEHLLRSAAPPRRWMPAG